MEVTSVIAKGKNVKDMVSVANVSNIIKITNGYHYHIAKGQDLSYQINYLIRIMVSINEMFYVLVKNVSKMRLRGIK